MKIAFQLPQLLIALYTDNSKMDLIFHKDKAKGKHFIQVSPVT